VNYATSKAGLIGMTKTLAKEAARRQVRVNAIAPGMFKSDMTDVLSDKIKSRILETIPMQRFGNVAELAEVAAFLAEAPYITGQTIVVDGGQSM
ncbi:MAG: SDR family oxidoreductase, partial [Leuconostoc citreum]